MSSRCEVDLSYVIIAPALLLRAAHELQAEETEKLPKAKEMVAVAPQSSYDYTWWTTLPARKSPPKSDPMARKEYLKNLLEERRAA
jgi:hypothetical protein